MKQTNQKKVDSKKLFDPCFKRGWEKEIKIEKMKQNRRKGSMKGVAKHNSEFFQDDERRDGIDLTVEQDELEELDYIDDVDDDTECSFIAEDGLDIETEPVVLSAQTAQPQVSTFN